MEDPYGPWTESVTKGSFKKTLAESADVAFLLNHTGMTLARTKPGTLKLSEVVDGANSPVYGITGLHTEALLDPQNLYVQAMRSAVDRGDLDEMSFAFRVLRQEWNEDYTRRWINEVSLDKGDVSLVNFGANPHTGGSVALRQRFFDRPALGRTVRASDTESKCNRCKGDGTIVLQEKDVTCPQCGGTGTGENNAGNVGSDSDDVRLARLQLELLRYPPSTRDARLQRDEILSRLIAVNRPRTPDPNAPKRR
jgi:HK97 family phage prohead protease